MRAENAASLAHVLFGKTRGAVLALLYGNPGASYYYRQLTRELNGVGAGALQRELDTLSRLGLVHRRTVGQQVFYSANREHPLFPELRSLVSKTLGAYEILRAALAPLAGNIALAFVFGSMARGDDRAASDIDLFLIGEVTLDALLRRLEPAEKSLGRAVNPALFSRREFLSRAGKGNHFVLSVVRGPKVFLIGDERELGKMGGVRLAEGRTHQPRRGPRPPVHHRA